MIQRMITRTVKNSTETTTSTSSMSSDALAFNILNTDYFYVGYQYPFASRHFQVGVGNNDASVLTVEFWNGTTWEAVDDLIDQTISSGCTFGQSGFISWQNKGTWAKKAITGIDSDIELYWLRMSVSASLDSLTTLQSVENLFSDDNDLRILYPELITDTRFLPSSRTNFLEQHKVAKDAVVLRLKQRKLIDNEGQIIDINAVNLAAVHFCAFAILNPIATDEITKALRDQALKLFNEEIDSINLNIDQDKDGIVSESEKLESMRTSGVYRR